jgi:hypothetical protein
LFEITLYEFFNWYFPFCCVGCDLYHGNWVHDPLGPLYTNNTCPVITQMQNCQGNGRPDKDYENWRWKPFQCDIPRFDPRKFLELMRGKTLAFIGDSVARNQMESMLCILWQVFFLFLIDLFCMDNKMISKMIIKVLTIFQSSFLLHIICEYEFSRNRARI